MKGARAITCLFLKRPFTRAQFRRFILSRSKPNPEMVALDVAQITPERVAYIDVSPCSSKSRMASASTASITRACGPRAPRSRRWD